MSLSLFLFLLKRIPPVFSLPRATRCALREAPAVRLTLCAGLFAVPGVLTHTAAAADSVYVSALGDDAGCDGSSPDPWSGSGAGCALRSIGAGIDAVDEGGTVYVLAGLYVENVVVEKPVTILGTTPDEVVLTPAFSNPDCEGDSLCSGEASTLILVRASGVTISSLMLEGDNPELTSGVDVNGADIDARNGIVTDRSAGVFDDLEVSDVIVQNVWLRGIFASSGGSFDFQRNTVRNVMGIAGSSVALLNFEGGGVMADNYVEYSWDALASNHSRGVQFLRNTVVASGSGVHTDNAGGGGGEADLIEANDVSACLDGGYGVWAFLPYLAPTLRDNRVTSCSLGLGAFGLGASVTPLFEANEIDGAGVEDAVGVYVTGDWLGFGVGDASATFKGNRIQNNAVGVLVLQEEGFSSTVKLRGNRLRDNGIGVSSTTGAQVDARYNGWGCIGGPEDSRCDSVEGEVSYSPWIGYHLSGHRQGRSKGGR